MRVFSPHTRHVYCSRALPMKDFANVAAFNRGLQWRP
jgi:hypothetical protein